jgi:hypothetical protein
MTVPAAAIEQPTTIRSKWQHWHTLACVLIIAAVVALAIWAATSHTLLTDAGGRLPIWTFLGLAALLSAFTVLIGWAITGRAGGALIDPKKARYSLSRLQMISWTILILAAYLNAFIVNIAAGRTNPVDVGIPGALLAAMGVSIGGLLGTQLVLGYKQSKSGSGYVSEDGGKVVVMRDDASTAVDAAADPSAGSAVMKAPTTGLSDIFKGDTVASSSSLDLGKIQLFYVTVALVLGYGIFVATGFAHVPVGKSGGIGSLPEISQGFVALLALSHGGYLSTKATS